MEKNPCVGCGACCSHFRVSFFWGECESSGGTVPDEKVIQISSSYVCMKGTEKKPSRCSELCGTVGDNASCGMYAKRSTSCRDFEASFSDGIKDERCDQARIAHGLKPLTIEDWI